MIRLILLALPIGILSLVPTNENVTPFDNVDSDHNGEVDFTEFENWFRVNSPKSNNQEAKRLFQKFDVNNNGKLDITEFVPLAFELSKKPIDTEQAIFRQLDLNQDSVVDLQEAALARKRMDGGIIDGLLAVADINRDGQLTWKEFTAQLEFNRPQQQLDANREVALKLLAFVDTDADNKLSPKEVYKFASQGATISEREVMNVFLVLDTNRDAVLDLSEIEKIPSSIIELLQINVEPPKTV
ncbi:hypothetical protein WR25_17814 [Diploscapter pachys]|uniref:EF-hand domain-containing protein n=1 Tax=Diploscapter pachys TaxID=2018661 RepID=A0A2A2KND5_9BILA|nr:hypothetical protein WR25_17814 [Diploscapter pachys]